MSPAFISLLYFGLCLGQAREVHHGSLPKPSLSALEDPVMAPGGELMLKCGSSSQSSDHLLTFKLLKNGTLEVQQCLSSFQGIFFLGSLAVQDSGNYSCIYYKTTNPHVQSESSEALEIWVTDTLPKPSLSAWPSHIVTSGGNVSLLCQGPSRGVRFALYKDGEETPVATSEPSQDGAEFPLIHVSLNQTGQYTCSYLLGRGRKVSAPPSDPLELTIREEQNESLLKRVIKTILITIFSCAFILFFLLSWNFVGHCHTQTVISHAETSRRYLCCPWFVCFSVKSAPAQEETNYAQVTKCRHSRTSVHETEDPQELTYIQLNPRAFNEQQRAPGKTSPDPTMYAPLALY